MNLLKISLRNLLKNKLQASIHIIGLTVGLTAVICIALYLQNELSYDNFHVKDHQLYRIGMKVFRQGTQLTDGHFFTPPMGPAMKEELAGVKNYTRYKSPVEVYFSAYEKSLKVNKVLYADSSFFSLFSFPLIAGNPANALTTPYSLVLTESTASRLFGTSDVLGEIVQLNNGEELQITAIAADPPANSHIEFKALIAFSTLYKDPGNFMDWKGGEQYVTYIQLDENADPTAIEQQFPAFLWRHINQEYANYNLRLEANLQPLPAIHLHHNAYAASLRMNLYILAVVALLILIIACINFINISTAWAVNRAKEVGVRKVLGASRMALGRQFMGETFLIIGIAFILSLFLVEAVLPLAPRLFGKPIFVPEVFQWTTTGGLLLLLVLVGLGAGSYPAFYMTSFDAVKVLKGLHTGTRKSKFRNGLVIFQFAVSTILIISTLVITQQLNFTKNKMLGFDKENILVLPLVGAEVQSKVKALKQALKKSPNIVSTAACSQTPGKGFTQNGYRPEGMEDPVLIKVVHVDDDFYQLFDLELTEGRVLSIDKPGDRQAYLINESLAQQLDWKQPIGKKISRDGEHQVVGVIKDFHFASLHKPIEPLIITCSPYQDQFDYLAVKLAAGNIEAGIQATQAAWKQVFPNQVADYWFLDDEIQQIYDSEQRLQKAFLGFSGLSIFIALMGIFGLITYAVEQRTKEIGIRKVLGASVIGIIGLLSKNFLKLVGFSIILAAPLAYFFMEKWLQHFAYRIDIHWGVFVIAGILAILVAFLTVSFQSVRAALVNPVQSLRRE